MYYYILAKVIYLVRILNYTQWANPWKKSILAGQCSVCHKGQNQCFLKFFRVEGSRKKTLILAFEANSATTQTHIWHWIFFRVLAHCAVLHITLLKAWHMHTQNMGMYLKMTFYFYHFRYVHCTILWIIKNKIWQATAPTAARINQVGLKLSSGSIYSLHKTRWQNSF